MLDKKAFVLKISDSCDYKTNELRVRYKEISPQESLKTKESIWIRIHEDGISYRRNNDNVNFQNFFANELAQKTLSETGIYLCLNKGDNINWPILFSTLKQVFRGVHEKREKLAIHKRNKIFDSLSYGEKCLIAGKESLHVEIHFSK